MDLCSTIYAGICERYCFFCHMKCRILIRILGDNQFVSHFKSSQDIGDPSCNKNNLVKVMKKRYYFVKHIHAKIVVIS